MLLMSCGPTASRPQSILHSPHASPSLRQLESCIQPADLATEVAFTSTKGEQVIGAVLGEGDVGVVLAHQFQSDLCEWVDYAKRLRDMGRSVLIFDFGFDLVGDVVGAATELRRDGATKIVLVGGSMGGTASLVAATMITPPVVGVASLSGPAEFSAMDGMAASKQLTIPVLYMAAENDNKPFPSDARAMYAACPSVHKQLLILPGNDHGSDLLGGVAGDRARATLETFIAGAAA
jgi:pimeloyl-ACP methyl ester carboxylesterase